MRGYSDDNFDKDKAKDALNENLGKAEKLLEDEDKMERFLQRLEKKLEVVPIVGKKLANVPIMASLVKSYVKKEYTDIPLGSLLAILAALIYFVSPIDLIPDNLPIVGYIDDAAVVAACWALVDTDVEEYKIWREENGKVVKDI